MNRRQFSKITALGAVASAFLGCFETLPFPFKKNQIIGCFGDSITFAGKNGYVEMLQKIVDEKRPELNLTFINLGKSSETITGLTEVRHPGPRPYLFERLEEELQRNEIDIAFFCYGINCGIYGKPSQRLFDSYRIGVLSFLEKMKQKKIQTILLTPTPLTLNTVPIKIDDQQPYSWKNPYRNYDEEVLQEFSKIIVNIEHHSAIASINVHDVLLENQKDCYEKDPIHPNLTGHRLISNTIVENLGI